MKLILSAAGVLWRRGPAPELFLARRVEGMRFFGGVYAFCGGRVDPVDRDVDSRASKPGEEGLRSCLVREVIEELGVDLRTGRRADPGLRSAVQQDVGAWSRACDPGTLDSVAPPCLRLVTPDFYPRRFDTRFSIHEVEQGVEPELQESELDAGGWDTAAGWLARWGDGEFFLAPPALLMLRVLAAHAPDGWPAALAAAQERIEDPALCQEIRLDPAVRLIPLRTPTLPPARHTNCYLVGARRAWLVDPATPWEEERGRLVATLEESRARVQGILLTHHHPDHVGAAAFMAGRLGVPIVAHAETARLLAGRIQIERTIADGEAVDFEHADGVEGRLVALFTPGHAAGHLCFREERFGGLLAGDMVSTLSSILVDPADGDMAIYMDSLARLAALGVETVYPAHGPADSRGVRVIEEQIAHRQARTDAVLSAVRAGTVDLSALTAEVWGDVPRPMLGYAEKSAVSILRMLAARGEVRFDGRTVRPA